MERNGEVRGAVQVGLRWGSIGGVLGLAFSVLGSLAGIVVAGFVGIACGRRAADAEAGRKSGALAGLVGGAIAAPVFVLGAATGGFAVGQMVGAEEISAVLSETVGMDIPPDQAWTIFIASLIVAALIQATILILASVGAGAWRARRSSEKP